MKLDCIYLARRECKAAARCLSVALVAVLSLLVCRQLGAQGEAVEPKFLWTPPKHQTCLEGAIPGTDLGPGLSIQGEAQAEKAVVATSFYPTTFLAERLGGEHFDVRCLLPSEEDPVHWKPATDVLRQFRAADLIILQGGGLDAWARIASLPRSRVLETTRGFREQLLEYSQEQTHSHGREGEHSHRGTDPHVWLDPHLFQLQAHAVGKALTKLSPKHTEEIEQRSDKLKLEIDKWDSSLKSIAPLLDDEPLLAAHPAYDYLAKRYGWKISNFDLNPMQMPGEADFDRMRQFVSEGGARFILWESSPSAAVEQAVKDSTGLISLVFSPCEKRPRDPEKGSELERPLDYLEVMNRNVQTLLNALKSK